MSESERHHRGVETFPIVEETATVTKRQRVKGRVRVTKRLHVVEEALPVDLAREEVTVERVPVNRVVQTAPQVRVKGSTTIIPVVEEEVVVTTRLILKEEVRITKRTIRGRATQMAEVRKEEVLIERQQEPEP